MPGNGLAPYMHERSPDCRTITQEGREPEYRQHRGKRKTRAAPRTPAREANTPSPSAPPWALDTSALVLYPPRGV